MAKRDACPCASRSDGRKQLAQLSCVLGKVLTEKRCFIRLDHAVCCGDLEKLVELDLFEGLQDTEDFRCIGEAA